MLTRLYNPEEFGLLAVLMSFMYLLGILFTGKYEFAILLPENDVKGIALLKFCLFLSLFFFIVCIVAILLLDFIFDIGKWIYFLPILGMLTAVHQSFTIWFNRKKNYTLLSKDKIFRVVVNMSIAISMGFLGYTTYGLSLALLLSQSLAVSIFIYIFFKNYSFKKIEISTHLKQVAKRYIDFPKYILPSTLSQRGAVELPILFLTKFFDSAATGYFSLAQKVFIAPASLIVSSISNVFRQEATMLYQKQGHFDVLLVGLVKRLAIFVIPCIVLSYFVIIDVFVFVFGGEWRVAGEYAQLLLPLFMLQFIVSPVSTAIIVVEKQKVLLFVQLFLLLGSAFALFIGYYWLNSSRASVLMFSLMYSLKYIIELLLSYKYSKGKNR